MPRVALRVAAAALLREGAAGWQVLIARRPQGKWGAGRWEFPGGKFEPGESPRQALDRELREELGIEVRAAELLDVFPHSYPDRDVEISLWMVPAFGGEPRGLEGQLLRWVDPGDLPGYDLLEAALPMIAPLRRSVARGVTLGE